MKRKLLLILITTAVALALIGAAVLAWPYLDPTLVNLQGLLLVLGGTLIASVIGHSTQPVLTLLRRIPKLLRQQETPDAASAQTDYQRFLQVAHWYRRGDPRAAERTGQTIEDEFLRTGTLLALDPHNGEDLRRMLQWRIRQQKETDNRDIRILRTMATFAPAFGMLGTLLGLVALLGNLSQSSLESIGVTMGFALMSTLYGLVAANLIFRPLALKLEEQARRRLLRMNFLTDALIMLLERQHPTLIGEYITTAQPSPTPALGQRPAAPDPARTDSAKRAAVAAQPSQNPLPTKAGQNLSLARRRLAATAQGQSQPLHLLRARA